MENEQTLEVTYEVSTAVAAALDGFSNEQAELALDGFDNLQADGRLERFCGPREQCELIALFDRIRTALGR